MSCYGRRPLWAWLVMAVSPLPWRILCRNLLKTSEGEDNGRRTECSLALIARKGFHAKAARNGPGRHRAAQIFTKTSEWSSHSTSLAS